MDHELSWEKFMKDAKEIIKESDLRGDGWELIGEETEPFKTYLCRKSVSKSSKTGRCIRWEHHVCYSLSYFMPVLYFNAWTENGTLLSLNDVWEYCHPYYTLKDEMYSTLTQQEHPILLRPFFTIHPCKTSEFLSHTSKDINVLVKFITCVGPMVNISMAYSYGKLGFK